MNENNGMILEEQDGVLILSMNMPGNNLMKALWLISKKKLQMAITKD